MGLDVPIAFCIYNRPHLTRQVFESIRRQRPRQLLVIGDGAREHLDGDTDLVRQTREIATQVDWDCELITHFSDHNLGCRQRMASGISWAFEQAEQLIILEDDCLPDDSFYGFCSQLLKKYERCPDVMMISGDNFQPERRSSDAYYFSRWAHIWGWASWRRAWQQYDLNLTHWATEKRSRSIQFDTPEQAEYWENLFDRVAAHEIDTWDFSWQYTICKSEGLVILPQTNLISNLGFGQGATHTTDPESQLAKMPTFPIGELIHPQQVERDVDADQWTFDNIFRPLEEASPSVTWWKKLFRLAS